MTGQEVRNSVQMKLKNHVSYNTIKNLNASFWKNVYESRCSHMSKTRNMHTIYLITRRFLMQKNQYKCKKKFTISVEDSVCSLL